MVERRDTTGYTSEEKAAGTPAGVQELLFCRGPVVSSLSLLNHRLLAEMPPASSGSKSVIHGREEYKNRIQSLSEFEANGMPLCI